MKSKKILSALAALAVLTGTTGVCVFANNLSDAKEESDTAIVTTTEEAAEEEAAEEEVIEEVVEETTEDETVSEETADAEEAGDVAAETEEKVEPKKHIGVKEMVKKDFDLEALDFVDDDAKDEWFDFCENDFLVEPKKPEAPVVDDAEKPEPPAAPAEDDAEKPEPPVVDDANKPEPPAKPVDVKELVKATFDFENKTFVDDDAKAAWFDFVINTMMAEPAAPIAPADGEKPQPPVIDDTNKPEPPAGPADGEKPQPPVIDDSNKPEPPAAPAELVKPEPPVAPEDAPIPPHLRAQMEAAAAEEEAAEETVDTEASEEE